MVIANPTASSRVYFLLDTRSVSQFKYRQAFSTSIGEFTYRRTYSRCDDGVQENWYDTVLRVVNGCYTLQYRHHVDNNIMWDEAEKQAEAAEMFERIFLFKFTPPGRGLWIMGTDALLEKGLGAALMNCSFVSTKPYGHKPSASFGFAMDMLMLGVGVGFDVFGVGTRLADPTGFTEIYIIPDTREGWVESVMMLIDSYTISDKPVHFNYSLLRPKGALIKTFGGKASGAEPLRELHEMIRERLSRSAKHVGHMTITDVNDIMTYIARCVVSGNVRRSAMLSLGPSDSTEFTNLKHPELYPIELQTHRWASNNSIVAEPGQNYDHITDLIMQNGEPGLIWLENVRNFGRYADGPDNSDWRAAGVNPCGEQPLESYEACNLVECYPFHHDSYEDFKRTLMFAHIYGKSVALMGNHWSASNEVMMRNRRIGIGQSGIQQFIAKHGIAEWIEWSDKGYKHLQNLDRWLSSEWSVPESIRLTTVKPSGTVSILGNATPGLHYPVADRFYIRRIRVSDNEAELLNPLLTAGYPVEKDFYSPNTFVAEFPCDAGVDVPSEANVPLATQMDMAALAQTFWSDNAVSYTAKFYESEADQIAPLLRRYDKKLKGMSFLKQGGVTYVQQPYQGITEEEYKLRLNALKPIQWIGQTQAKGEMYCSNDSCSIM